MFFNRQRPEMRSVKTAVASTPRAVIPVKSRQLGRPAKFREAHKDPPRHTLRPGQHNTEAVCESVSKIEAAKTDVSSTTNSFSRAHK